MENAERHSQQTTQYVVGSDRRFGVLFVLDCSPKSQAPGSVANDINEIVTGSAIQTPIVDVLAPRLVDWIVWPSTSPKKSKLR